MARLVPRATADMLPFDPDAWIGIRHGGQLPADAGDSFWPGVSSRLALENQVPFNPENRAARVLSEIAVLFGVIAAFIAAVWVFLPSGTAS